MVFSGGGIKKFSKFQEKHDGISKSNSCTKQQVQEFSCRILVLLSTRGDGEGHSGEG